MYQSPYGAFCLRPLSLNMLTLDDEFVSCNPLTGLFVCDLGHDYRVEGLHHCCNPLTGLFVCDFVIGILLVP